METKDPDRAEFKLTTSAKAREIGRSEATVRAMGDKGQLDCIRDSNGDRLFRPGSNGARDER